MSHVKTKTPSSLFSKDSPLDDSLPHDCALFKSYKKGPTVSTWPQPHRQYVCARASTHNSYYHTLLLSEEHSLDLVYKHVSTDILKVQLMHATTDVVNKDDS